MGITAAATAPRQERLPASPRPAPGWDTALATRWRASPGGGLVVVAIFMVAALTALSAVLADQGERVAGDLRAVR
jgi:hypothetical protein